MFYVQGKILYFADHKPPTIITDPEKFIQVVRKICEQGPDHAGSEVRCVAKETKLWRDRSMLKMAMEEFGDLSKENVSIFLHHGYEEHYGISYIK